MKVDTFTNTIIVEDTTKILPELIKAQKQYDVIIADPPYNIGKDFGNDTEVMPIDDYVQWAESWIRDCLHLLTDDGLLYLYGFPEIIARISVRFPIHEQRWLVWHYTNKNGAVIEILAAVARNDIMSLETEYAAYQFGD